MQKRKIASYICLAVVVTTIMPLDLLATTTDFGAAEIEAHGQSIKGLLMGPALKIAGVIGATWGMAQSYMQQSPMPFLTFGGIGLVSNIMPTFIDKVIGVSTMLLP